MHRGGSPGASGSGQAASRSFRTQPHTHTYVRNMQLVKALWVVGLWPNHTHMCGQMQRSACGHVRKRSHNYGDAITGSCSHACQALWQTERGTNWLSSHVMYMHLQGTVDAICTTTWHMPPPTAPAAHAPHATGGSVRGRRCPRSTRGPAQTTNAHTHAASNTSLPPTLHPPPPTPTPRAQVCKHTPLLLLLLHKCPRLCCWCLATAVALPPAAAAAPSLQGGPPAPAARPS